MVSPLGHVVWVFEAHHRRLGSSQGRVVASPGKGG